MRSLAGRRNLLIYSGADVRSPRIEPEAVASSALADCAGPASPEARRSGRHKTRHADSAVAPGMVFIPFCYAEVAANILTNPQLDPIGKIPEFKFCAAKVEPATMQEAAE